jgi:RNA polymerase sigma-70 factor, ECF subfamily
MSARELRWRRHAMKTDPQTRDQMLSAIPHLRAFAISLCGNADWANDLVQDTLLRALTHIGTFEPGSNMLGWLFTILRNQFYSEYRKRRREVQDSEGKYAETLKSQPGQFSRIEFAEFRAAIAKLPAEQREILILVGAAGLSYDEASAICGCPIGTLKSRLNRARARLAEMLSIESGDDFGPDPTTRAVLAATAN